ncbi:helix-turn-helix transcriptional regulator [Tissierella praeacuta]|uniref:helix-turn-helix transcriptional regulator n=1 Tax=Tissierella praeacuta TaxID=43131 RepID=UPI001C107633|nr:helix-turn-helix transcriptional regulator [Tissierella praeacuta]MBU5254997.1 helix-turn-helix transcriptional regulator [Tissierella praeacuta]
MKLDINKIKLERANQGLTMGELAEKSGLNLKTISKLENGSDSLRLVTVGKVAKALGKRIEDFVVNEKR